MRAQRADQARVRLEAEVRAEARRLGADVRLAGELTEQSAANAKLIVCLDNNTKVLEECRDELRSVRMERKQV